MKTKTLSDVRSAAKPAMDSIVEFKFNASTEGLVASTAAGDPGHSTSPEDETTAFWVNNVSSAIGYSAGWLVKAGQELNKAKRKLGHGRWLAMFELGGLGISACTAEHLMKIGNHPYFSKMEHLSNLPPCCLALYQLSKLDAVVIERGMEQGTIGPSTTIAQAKRFVHANGPQTAETTKTPAIFDTKKCLGKLRSYVMKVYDRWPDAQHSDLAALLEAMAVEIRLGEGAGRDRHNLEA